MTIDSNTLVSISEANQNFSHIAKLVDQYGSVVILKNNSPRYIVLDFNQAEDLQSTSDDDVLSASRKIIERNKHVYEELAK